MNQITTETLNTTTFSFKWVSRFLNLAGEISGWSKDPNTKVGCVLVKDHRVIATGYNGMAAGVNDNVKERSERPEKYHWYLHAEINALLQSAKFGVQTKGATAFVTHKPCSQCMSALANAGITEIFVVDQKDLVGNVTSESQTRAVIIARETKITVYEVSI